jgi:hypothetical protein
MNFASTSNIETLPSPEVPSSLWERLTGFLSGEEREAQHCFTWLPMPAIVRATGLLQPKSMMMSRKESKYFITVECMVKFMRLPG